MLIHKVQELEHLHSCSVSIATLTLSFAINSNSFTIKSNIERDKFIMSTIGMGIESCA